MVMLDKQDIEDNQICGVGVGDYHILKSKVLLRPDEVAGILRVSKRQVYYLCSMLKLDTVNIGESVRIKTVSVINMLKGGEKNQDVNGNRGD